MSAIEPDVGALIVFSTLWGATCLGFLILAGMYPERPEDARRPGGGMLVALNTLLWLALAAATLAFGYERLRLTSLIVVAGLVFLFAPVPFEFLPERWRDGRKGLAALVVFQAAALAGWLMVSQHGAAYLPDFAS